LLAASQPSEDPSDQPAAEKPSASTKSLNTRLGQELGPGMSSHDFITFFVADKEQRILASTYPDDVGQIFAHHEAFLTRALSGQTTVCPPFPSTALLKDEFGRRRT